MSYEEQLFTEVISVGLMTAGLSKFIEKVLPRTPPFYRLVLTGMLFHLTAEYTGMNEWYLHNGASYMKYRRENPEKENCPMIRESECQFTSWEESSASSCFSPP
jgi:hypothetical protein